MTDERAAKILEAAAELLLRWGYRKITVEDIARQAGVGKGTVYLHWKTKQDVFYGVFMQEGIELTRTLLDRMREDAAFVLPGPMAGELFRLVMRRPISKAMFTGNSEILGDLVESTKSRQLQLTSSTGLYGDYLQLLLDNGLVRTDLDTKELIYVLEAVTIGFYFLQEPLPLVEGLSFDTRAALMAEAIDRVAAPEIRPDPHRLHQVQAEAIAIFEKMLTI